MNYNALTSKRREHGGFLMNKTLLIITLVLSFAALAKDCKDGNTGNIPDAIKAAAKYPPGSVPLHYDNNQTTPKGARVRGKNALSPQQLALVDAGIDALMAAKTADGFLDKASKPHSFFEIFTPPLPCIPSPETRTPSFVINGGQGYDGTIYDYYNPKGQGVPDGISVIFAAEMVLSLGTPRSVPNWGRMYVCPDAAVLANGVRHGGDHIFLANFPYTADWHQTGRDGYSYFNRSINHSGGIGHPLLPRNERLSEHDMVVSTEDFLTALPDAEERALSKGFEDAARDAGIILTGNETESQAVAFRPVR
jgi:hypothetical protein